MFLAFSIVQFICLEEENGDEIQASIQPGKLFLFSVILIIYLCVVIIMITDRAVSMQPWIRLTLYNPNQCKFLNYVTHFLVVIFHQKALAILHSWVAH